MKSKLSNIIFPVFLTTLLGFLFVFNFNPAEDEHIKISKIRSTDSPKAEEQSVKDRDEYFFRMLRDPKTNSIPNDAVTNEIKFSERIKNSGLRKSGSSNFVNWKEAGPKDVGGRTRALGVDVRDANIILAGGVSGGIWKSTNKGQTWNMKFTTSQVLSVSSLAQDTMTGHEDTWYAATGERRGNSASQTGAQFQGAGIYKSTDNGDTWQLIPKQDDITAWDHPLDFVSKIAVNPTTSSIFVASNGYGIFKSTNEGINFQNILSQDNRYCELDIAADGTIIVTLSENDAGGTPPNVGVWMSNDDGVNWTDVTPADYPVGLDYNRAVAAIAPSNTNICYVLLEVVDTDEENDHRIYKINLASNTSEDFSANLPNFNGSGIYTSQGSYDMLVAVKPDDENFVLIGGTNLYRSYDGFSSPLNDNIDDHWIGGYATDGNGSYPNSHPDIHSFAFDLEHPDRVWIGHDGGLSYTTNILGKKNVDFSSTPWQNKNNGYNVTQVYHVSIPHKTADNRIMAGCQDNGTPFFSFDGKTIFNSYDVSSGDGSYCYFGKDFAYVSTQNGSILQLGYDGLGNVHRLWDGISATEYYAFVHPASADGQLFINPFSVDPIDENIMYYPAGTSIWRNKTLNEFTRGSGGWDGQDDGWEKLMALEAPPGYTYSAINVSNENNSHVLYFAAYNPDEKPKIYRLDNANTSTSAAVDISIPFIPGISKGAYITEIAINPENSNEILVAASNYNIIGLYHSKDGGESYNGVEGNLEGENGKGPSIRSAEILPVSNGTVYLVGTSVGLFSTSSFDGVNTVWKQEGADVIGNVVVASIAARTSDNYVAVGTHGRGVFTGTVSSTVGVEDLTKVPTEYTLSQNYPNPFNPSTKIRYSVPLASNVSLKIFNTNGEEVAEVVNQYQGAGTFEVDWNGTNSRGAKVASGAYVYTLRAGDFVQSKKMLLLK